MSRPVDDVLARLRDLEQDLARGWEERRQLWRYRLEAGRARFEDEVLAQHRRLRVGLFAWLRRSRFLVLLAAPLIYAQAIPLALLDVFLLVYVTICFPAYGIPRPRRRDHVVIDRQRLAYLNGLEKVNCVYCGWANGVISWAREVASLTEEHWCPIQHARPVEGSPARYHGFADYGDPQGYRERVERSRGREVAPPAEPTEGASVADASPGVPAERR